MNRLTLKTKEGPARTRRRSHRRASLGLMLAAPMLALVVAACAAAAGAPAYTYPPTSSPSASAPATPAAPAPSASASAAPDPTGIVTPVGATLHISAQGIQFDTDHLEAPAGHAFTLEFDNNDPGIPHNVEIRDGAGTSMFKGQIITGPAKVSYQVPALAAGSYLFVCDVHPDMTGTLTVQ